MPTPENFELSTINPIPKMPRKKFGPGNPSLGRLKGAINKVTRDIKNGVITAAENLGRDGKGAGGLVGCLEYVGVNHPKAFCHLLRKMLPMQISSDGTIGNRIGTVNIVSIPHDHYLRSEESSVCDRLGTGLSIRRQPSPIPPSRRNSALCYPSVIPSGTLENNFSLYHQLNLPKHLFTNQVLHRHRSWQTAPGINTVIMRRLDEEEIRKRENENDVLIERQRVNHRRDESRVNERSAKRKRDKLP